MHFSRIFRKTFREFRMQPALELRRSGEFIEDAPILRSTASSMASAAIRQAAARIDVILPNELRALRGLVRRRVPVHVINFRARPDEILRLAVAFQTPLHVKRLRPPRDRHLVDLAVTSRAADAFRDVNAVIEIDEVRQIVHAVPARSACLVRGSRALERASALPSRSASDTSCRCRWRDSGEGGFFDRSMAVATVDAVIEHMMFVTERHGLRERHVHVSRVGRPKNRVSSPARPAKRTKRNKQR